MALFHNPCACPVEFEVYSSGVNQRDSLCDVLHRTNTIYINVNDVHEGMLAHEMAHSIIDHYLMVPPPGTTAEILARYVDAHLHY